jgi:hypothetical protein
MAAGETDIALHNSEKDLALFNQYGVRNFWVLSTGRTRVGQLAAIFISNGAHHVSGLREQLMGRCAKATELNWLWLRQSMGGNFQRERIFG